MSRVPFRYHFLAREQLENELFELCLRLRRARQADRPDAGAGSTHGRRSADGADPGARRCYIALKHCADFDFPLLLEADDQVRALLRTLNDAASLLHRFAESERGAGDRYLPS